MKNLTFAALVVLTLTGCAFTPQKAVLSPTVDVAESSVGKGVTLAIRVIDERPSKSLGRRGTAYGAAAEITSERELAVVVHEQLVLGLKKKGFEVIDADSNSDPSLAVEIRLLEYSTSTGFWTGGVNVQGALKALGRRGGKSFEQMYRSDKEERVVVVPTAETNQEWINRSLSDVLNQLFADQALFVFLGG